MRSGDDALTEAGKLDRSNRSGWTAAFLPLPLVFLAYYPVLTAGFVNWDDPVYLLSNPLIRDMSPSGLLRMFTSTWEGNYHPLTLLSYALQYRFHGLDPFPYHLMNLALHLANTLLAGWLTMRFFGRSAAVMVALAFGLHPLRVEPAAWISERKEVLAAFFSLGALLLYSFGGHARRRQVLAGSFVLFLLAILSKPMAVTLPLLMLVVDLAQGRRPGEGLAAKAPFFLAAALASGGAWAAQAKVGALTDVIGIYGWRYPLLLGHNVWFYLEKTLSPVRLSAFYPYPHPGDLVLPLNVLQAFLGAGAFIGLALWKRRPPMSAAGAWFFLLSAAPVLRIIPVGNTPTADRYAYLPGLGLLWAMAGVFLLLVGKAGPAARKGALAALAAWTLLLGAASWQRAAVWRDSVSLWSDVVRLYPRDFLARFNLGRGWLDERNDPGKAAEQFSAALALRPDHVERGRLVGDPYIHHQRGRALLRLGRRAEAERDFALASSFKPDYQPPLMELRNLRRSREVGTP